jgi:hypothetical protein
VDLHGDPENEIEDAFEDTEDEVCDEEHTDEAVDTVTVGSRWR